MGKKTVLDPKRLREAIIAQLHDPHFLDDDGAVKEPKKKPRKPGQDS